ncbi:MAG: helix-turn-helix transcriptional regulator [Gammaproteobacteria bacterium]|nr:helix-turn-helix transcriptional regulator [Gammaproteobacteria bacterium]
MRGSAEKLYAAFGELVVAHRRRVGGMTQAELGRQIGLSRTSVTNIEQGRHHVSLDQFVRIAMALEVAPEALLPPLARDQGTSNMADLLPDDLPTELVEWADRL